MSVRLAPSARRMAPTLPRALGDGVARDAEEADPRKQERSHGEQREELLERRAAAVRAFEESADRIGLVERRVPIDVVHDARERVRQALRPERAANQERKATTERVTRLVRGDRASGRGVGVMFLIQDVADAGATISYQICAPSGLSPLRARRTRCSGATAFARCSRYWAAKARLTATTCTVSTSSTRVNAAALASSGIPISVEVLGADVVHQRRLVVLHGSRSVVGREGKQVVVEGHVGGDGRRRHAGGRLRGFAHGVDELHEHRAGSVRREGGAADPRHDLRCRRNRGPLHRGAHRAHQRRRADHERQRDGDLRRHQSAFPHALRAGGSRRTSTIGAERGSIKRMRRA